MTGRTNRLTDLLTQPLLELISKRPKQYMQHETYNCYILHCQLFSLLYAFLLRMQQLLLSLFSTLKVISYDIQWILDIEFHMYRVLGLYDNFMYFMYSILILTISKQNISQDFLSQGTQKLCKIVHGRDHWKELLMSAGQ